MLQHLKLKLGVARGVSPALIVWL
jgi:hypothetical protein